MRVLRVLPVAVRMIAIAIASSFESTAMSLMKLRSIFSTSTGSCFR